MSDSTCRICEHPRRYHGKTCHFPRPEDGSEQ